MEERKKDRYKERKKAKDFLKLNACRKPHLFVII